MDRNLEFRKHRLLGMWRDLTSEPLWKYQELPPLLLAELTKLDLFEVGDSELARAQWLWSRRPKLTLHASTALLAAGLCVTLSLAIAFVAEPETSMLKRVYEMIISLLALARLPMHHCGCGFGALSNLSIFTTENFRVRILDFWIH